jgi:hypothetical protein
MPNGIPELRDLVDDLGQPSERVLAEARAVLRAATAAADSPVVPTAAPAGAEPVHRRRRIPLRIAIAAAITAAVAVPLLTRSGGAGQAVPSGRRPHLAPPADVAATPPGWAPVEFEGAQISVPASWYVVTWPAEECGGIAGMVVVGKGTPKFPSGAQCHAPPSVVSITEAGKAPLLHARSAVVNGVHVLLGRAGPASSTLVERGLGVDVAASGHLAAQVLGTITHSPLSVVLGSDLPTAPPKWKTVTFGGLRFSVPPSWRIEHRSWWGGCPGNLETGTLALSTARQPSMPACVAPPPFAGWEAGVPAMVVGAGPYVAFDHIAVGPCIDRNGLRICVEPPPLGSGSSPDRLLSILTAHVYLPGVHLPDEVDIGLAGSGVIPATIFDSLRPARGA